MGIGHNTFNNEPLNSQHLQAADVGGGVAKNVDVTSTTALENPFELF